MERTRGQIVLDQQTAFYAAAAADPSRSTTLWREAIDARNRSYLANCERARTR